MDEVLHREKFTSRFGLTPEDRADFLALVDSRATFVAPVAHLPIAVRDAKDDIVLATALGGEAEYLVTGDRDLLVLKDDPRLRVVQILTVREFLAILDSSD